MPTSFLGNPFVIRILFSLENFESMRSKTFSLTSKIIVIATITLCMKPARSGTVRKQFSTPTLQSIMFYRSLILHMSAICVDVLSVCLAGSSIPLIHISLFCVSSCGVWLFTSTFVIIVTNISNFKVFSANLYVCFFLKNFPFSCLLLT